MKSSYYCKNIPCPQLLGRTKWVFSTRQNMQSPVNKTQLLQLLSPSFQD